MGALTIWTIGHSNRTLEQFLELLGSQQIQLLADVRRFPGSRRLPHFNQENLSKSLADVGIEYVHFPELGGRRKALANSPNTAWRNESFRAYADFMMTEEFHAGIERLLEHAQLERLKKYCSHSERGFLGFGEALAKEQVPQNPVTEPKRSQNPKRPLSLSPLPNGYSIFENALKHTAIMCAEALWWQCHRSLIADYLKAAGHEVIHIMGGNKTQPHPFTSAARMVDGKLSYGAESEPQFLF